jgi:Mg-chelatase subunit ChlD
MDYPSAKMTEARAATSAAVDVIHDGARFAVVAGTSKAWPVYPSDGSMAVAGDRTRAEAKQTVARLRASGGTAIGQRLRLAQTVFQTAPATLRHTILLTDERTSMRPRSS